MTSRYTLDNPPKGIRRHGAGWQARKHVTGGGRPTKTFALATPFGEMIAWQEDTAYQLRRDARPRSPLEQRTQSGLFPDDAKRYLKAVAAMDDIRRRTKDILYWVEKFKARRTAAIDSPDIRTLRDEMLTIGPKMIYRKRTADRAAYWDAVATPLSGSTVNHRLRALSNLWTVLFPGQPNPVREVPEADETEALPRNLPYDIIERILAAMPDRGQGLRFEKRRKFSHTKLRLRVMMWTGLPHKQLAMLTEKRVNFSEATLITTKRKKGKGVEPQLLPLLPEAILALRDFFALGATGSFSASSMRQCFLRAVAKVKVQLIAEGWPEDVLDGVRPYDLRHSFGTEMYRSTGSKETAGEFLQHADPRTTDRYTLAAVKPVLQAALAKFEPAKSAPPQKKTHQPAAAKRA